MPSFEVPRPRTSDEEEEEEEEMEFKLAERTEAKPWFSLNKCIVGVVVLLFLGSLFLSGEFLSHLSLLQQQLSPPQVCSHSTSVLSGPNNLDN